MFPANHAITSVFDQQVWSDMHAGAVCHMISAPCLVVKHLCLCSDLRSHAFIVCDQAAGWEEEVSSHIEL